jgi:hypothetical protein
MDSLSDSFEHGLILVCSRAVLMVGAGDAEKEARATGNRPGRTNSSPYAPQNVKGERQLDYRKSANTIAA